MRRLTRIALIILLFPPTLAAVGGWLVAPAYLHPIRRPFTPDLIRDANATFAHLHVTSEPLDVRTSDAIMLHGWKVRAEQRSENWVLVFHGVADNRMGVLEHARVLLQGGYNVVMMDQRAHGASEGPIATYGWLERYDAREVITALQAQEHPRHIFALGESMGAGIALQAAGVDSRIEAVVAESAFANLREAAYDYAGLRRYPWLGKTWLAPGTWTMLYRGGSLAGIPTDQIAPDKSVAQRSFPVLLICDADDVALPCRHTEMIYKAAVGPKQMWVVPHAFHTAALGYQPEEFKRRVLGFFAAQSTPSGEPWPTTGKQ